ncbi:MAG TPA: biotin--[acetyl-CoA-carboxylase] ligase [Terrimicrobiaceae bacterium]
MNMPADSQEQFSSPAIVGARGWRLFFCETATSTNDLARTLPPWSAVRAATQTAARGRFGRSFVCDRGGLWLSAILPAEGGATRWTGFSLVVGYHLLLVLKDLAVPNARLRWPNDLMSGKKKLAGLLIEQGARDTLTIGVGLNVTNAPWQHDRFLEDSSTRLADLLTPIPDLHALATSVLDALANAHRSMQQGSLEGAIRELNKHWTSSEVKITLTDGETLHGKFMGLDERAYLRILPPSFQERLVAYQDVIRLEELARSF